MRLTDDLCAFDSRFLTILYYLDETQDGGETAFPVADNETFSDEVRSDL